MSENLSLLCVLIQCAMLSELWIHRFHHHAFCSSLVHRTLKIWLCQNNHTYFLFCEKLEIRFYP